jgi:bifunctional non-homologous end joining protein LigD
VKRARRVPVSFVTFDLLWLNGELLTSQPWSDRWAVLENLDLPGRESPSCPCTRGRRAPELLKACTEHRVEGMVVKELKGRYIPSLQ